jgi:hypothetical protein
MRRLALAPAVLLLALGAAHAQPAAPLKLTLEYDGRFYIKVLEMTLEQEMDADSFRASTHINTWGLGAIVKKMDQRATSTGRIDGSHALPGTFTHQNIDGKRDRRVVTQWRNGDVTTASTPAYDFWGDPVPTKAQKLSAADPLTQFVRITRSSTAAGPCSGDTHFFDGKQLYDFDFARPRPGGAPSDREKGMGLVNPVICEVQYREVAGFKKKPPEERSQGLKSAILARFGQLGPGGPWLLSSLQAETKWGRAVIDLRQVKTGAPATD